MEILSKEKVKNYSPAALAFYGDCAWEIFVRRKAMDSGNLPSAKLHESSVKLANASFQAQAADFLESSELLTEEERDILRRGRNAAGVSVPRSSNPRDYHKATALEALFGYLFLIGEFSRAEELFEVILNERNN